MPSYKVDCHDAFDAQFLNDERFATRAEAEYVTQTVVHGGDGYYVADVVETDDPVTIAADVWMAGSWPTCPGPCPTGIDPAVWFGQADGVIGCIYPDSVRCLDCSADLGFEEATVESHPDGYTCSDCGVVITPVTFASEETTNAND